MLNISLDISPLTYTFDEIAQEDTNNNNINIVEFRRFIFINPVLVLDTKHYPIYLPSM